MTLDQLNQLPEEEAWTALERCCGASAWVEHMLAERPFSDRDHLMRAAHAAAGGLSAADWREAFAHHPKIGDLDELRSRSTADWARGEQRGTSGGDEETLDALAVRNDVYEETFGYIFITCAAGKSARQMLEELSERLEHSPDEEIEIAAGEQMRITALRLAKLLDEGT